MRVKRFTGDNVADIMSKIKRELGSDAVILQTRQIKEGGFLGFFAKTRVEITAAIEEKPFNTSSRDAGLWEEKAQTVNTDIIKKAYEAYREKENEYAKEKGSGEFTNPQGGFEKHLLETTQSEIREMHSILKEINRHITKTDSDKESIPEPLVKWESFLTEKGISRELTEHLLDRVKNEVAQELWNNKNTVLEKIKKQIIDYCVNTETIRPRKSKTTVVALVGPTGVGKTTTIGKLAAGFSIIERRKVALVTADTYRVAAVEQLKTFGEIIGVPVEVVMTPDGLKEAIDRHRDKELIFIDTAGRSPHHELHMSELEAFLTKAKPDLTMLVMSVTTNLADQLKAFERFNSLSTHLILTKLDESFSLGSIVDLLVRTNLPIAYLTNGQNVPDDIDAATPEKLSGYILGEGIPNV
ncbi:MAG: Flagellar biosynthesis protein FlhF [Candidatus Dichloromethanomonas elyunquensis]|nr:MAG: Flagellar biosynthesis protein FlhF [Candidatus Dichloromethanomonas elyunquensis]